LFPLSFVTRNESHIHAIVSQVPDLKTVYSSARSTSVDPYDSTALLNEYAKDGGDVSTKSHQSAFFLYLAFYRPSSLFWVSPLTTRH
jgi:hypothetical protein